MSTGNDTVYWPLAPFVDVTPPVLRASVPSEFTTAHMMRGPHDTRPPARTCAMALPLAQLPLTRRCSRADVSPSRKSALRFATFVWLRPTASGGVVRVCVVRRSAAPLPWLVSDVVAPAPFDLPSRKLPPVAATAVPLIANTSAA